MRPKNIVHIFIDSKSHTYKKRSGGHRIFSDEEMNDREFLKRHGLKIRKRQDAKV